MQTKVQKFKSDKSVGAKRIERCNISSSRSGVVREMLQRTEIGSSEISSAQLIEELSQGLPVSELEELHSALQMPLEKLGELLGISKATLHRRKKTGRLSCTESDRVVRFARLVGMANLVMESPASGRRWLTTPQRGLGGAVPLDYARTEVGAREVENLLGRIEHSVYT